MHTQAQTQSTNRRQQQQQHQQPSLPIYGGEGLSAKKTALIIITVVGCVAILWPKVFYPMMFTTTPTASTKSNIKEVHRGPGGCCDVVLNREEFFNLTTSKKSKPSEEHENLYGPQLYRKSLNIYTGVISIRQERPPHLHPDSVYQAMRERGRAIPITPTIPIVERKSSPNNPPPRIVEGRPGPIPGMRPPMGAGSMHQPQGKGHNGMGIIMPLYTIGIVVFFGYTIMKIVFKKQIPNSPYGAAPNDSNFRKEVFGQENGRHIEELNGSKLDIVPHQQALRGSDLYNASLSAQTAATNLSSSLRQHQQQTQQQTSKLLNMETDQLMEIEKLRKKLEDTEKAMAKLIAEMNSDQYEAKKQSHENSITTDQEHEKQENISNGHANDNSRVDDLKATEGKLRKRDCSTDRTVSSKHDGDVMPEPQEIYLEGSLAHDSKILVAESETKQEEVYNAELNGSFEEPAVILSSKMTLSLINFDNIMDKKSPSKQLEVESPLADDIEIIGFDEH